MRRPGRYEEGVATKVKLKNSAALPGSSPRVGLGEVQLGQTGLKRSYGYVYEELLPQLAGLRAINVYQEMAQNSSVIGAVLFAIDMFMRKVAWRVEAASESSADQQKAEYLASCRDDMDHTWADFISEVNSMLVFGWSWFEIVYKQRFTDATDEFGSSVSQWNDGMIGWKKFMPISQDSWWRWDFDPATGQTIGMWQRPAPDYSERYIPIGKSLHFRTVSKKDNPEGVSILRTAYRSWYFLKRIEEIEAIGAERDLAGIPMATVPAEMLAETADSADKAMVASIVKMVQNVRRDEQDGIVWPQAYDEKGNDLYTFKLLSSAGTRQFQTEPIISRYQSNIAMTALADFLLLGNDSSNNGSYALATSKSSMFQSALETWLNSIENILNSRAVPLLFRQNGINSGPYPKFRHDIVQKPTLPDLATLISSMAGAGAQLFPDIELENHIREYAELPIREPNAKNVKLEEQIIAQQLQTTLASAAAEEDMAQRTAQDANAEGLVPTSMGSVIERMDPITLVPPAGGSVGDPGTQVTTPGAKPAAGSAKKPTAAQAGPATQKTAAAMGQKPATPAAGIGGKKKNSTPGAPTKSTGPVKSKNIPNNRRATVGSTKNTSSVRTGQGAGKKTAATRSVAKNMVMQDTAGVRKRVMQQASTDFPKFSMRWMKDALWTGPVPVPADAFDTSGENSWAASHEPEKVKAFTKRIKQGQMKPVIAVKIPGSNKLRIIDGHHHFLAYQKLGHPVLCYIGHVDQNAGPWDNMHDYQRMSDNSDSSAALKKYRVINSAKPKPYSYGEILEQLTKSTDVALKPYKYQGSNAGQMVHNQDYGQKTVKQQAKLLANSSKPSKKCDYCQRKASKVFVVPGSDGVFARSCEIHAPQARAELRWSANNQVSPVNASPYDPFPRVITQ
jgi:ParB-like nuclease domain